MNNKLNLLIVEDELLIAEMLKETLCELNYNVIAIVRNFDDTFRALEQNSTIDLIFLDINLNNTLSGLDIAKMLNANYSIPFIFLTSYSDSKTIQEAVIYQPQAYLLKPFTKSDLFVTLELFKSRNFTNDKYIEIKDGHFKFKIKHSEILWVKSENVYIEIKTLNKIHLVRNSLDKFLEQIDDENFIRIHRSYVVNLQYVKAINRVHIIVNNQKLPISRMHHEALVARFSS